MLSEKKMKIDIIFLRKMNTVNKQTPLKKN